MKLSYRKKGWTVTPLRIISFLVISWFIQRDWFSQFFGPNGRAAPTIEQGLAIDCMGWLMIATIFTVMLGGFCFSFPVVPGTYINGNQIIKTGWCGYSIVTYKDE